MSDEKSIEDLIFDFVSAAVEAAAEDTAIFGAEVHETIYGKITKVKVIQIGPCESSPAPNHDASETEEFDGDPVLVFLRQVGDRNVPTNYRDARRAVLAMMKQVAKLVTDDATLGGRVIDCLPGRMVRGFTTLDSQPFALGNLTLRVNETGQQLS